MWKPPRSATKNSVLLRNKKRAFFDLLRRRIPLDLVPTIFQHNTCHFPKNSGFEVGSFLSHSEIDRSAMMEKFVRIVGILLSIVISDTK